MWKRTNNRCDTFFFVYIYFFFFENRTIPLIKILCWEKKNKIFWYCVEMWWIYIYNEIDFNLICLHQIDFYQFLNQQQQQQKSHAFFMSHQKIAKRKIALKQLFVHQYIYFETFERNIADAEIRLVREQQKTIHVFFGLTEKKRRKKKTNWKEERERRETVRRR